VTDFKVGDKVKHNVRGDAEITYGPYTDTFGRTHSVIRLTSGRELAVPTSSITAAPAFAVGDKVAYDYGGGGTLVAGPFKSEYHGEPIWVVEKSNGTHMTPTENSLRKVDAEPTREIKVGDRVCVVKDDETFKTGKFIGRAGMILEAKSDGRALPFHVRLDDPSDTWNDGAWWCAEVELIDDLPADTYEYDGVVYDLAAQYRDREGDVWRLKRVAGTVRARWDGTSDPTEDSNSLATVVDTWGPLARV
jgi:hypothetical protein